MQPNQFHALTADELAEYSSASSERRRDLEIAAINRCGCFTQCIVNWHHGSLLVTLENGQTIFLQSDYEQAAFCDACGLFESETQGDSVDNPDWVDCDPTDIWYCPDYYLDIAE